MLKTFCSVALDLGIPLLTAHMVVLWYSHDTSVAPTVALEPFAASETASVQV